MSLRNKEKTKKRAAADRNQGEASVFLNMWGNYYQHLMTFSPRRGHCRHLGWVLFLFLLFSSHPLLNSLPRLNILHLFNYLAAALWLGPELQWRLYLQIRAGLVTGAGHISLSRRCLRARCLWPHYAGGNVITSLQACHFQPLVS